MVWLYAYCGHFMDYTLDPHVSESTILVAVLNVDKSLKVLSYCSNKWLILLAPYPQPPWSCHKKGNFFSKSWYMLTHDCYKTLPIMHVSI